VKALPHIGQIQGEELLLPKAVPVEDIDSKSNALKGCRKHRGIEIGLFLGVFLGSIWIHEPSRYYFFGDSWDVLYALLTNWKSILWLQNEHFIPLFKAFYLLEYKLFGHHHLGYMLVLFAMHAGIAVLVYRLGIHLSLRPWLASIAVMIFAFSSVHWEATGWSFEQQFILGTLLMLGAIDVFLGHPRRRNTLVAVALLSLAGWLAGGPIALCLPIVITAYCLLQVLYRRESTNQQLGKTLVALWLPAVAYLVCAKVVGVPAPGAPSLVPHLHLRDAPAFLDYTLFGTIYGVVLNGLTFLQAQNLSSAVVILIALAGLVGLCYRNMPSDRRSSFWFLVVFLFAPLLVTSLGRIQYGTLQALSSRYTYLPTVPFALLLVICWEGLRSQQARKGREVWWSGLGFLLLGYYFVFHFAIIRKQNPAADRGERAQQFLAIARRATYPESVQSGAAVLGPELLVPDYVCAPGPFLLWKAFQVLDGDTRKIAPVSGYLKNEDASFAANLVHRGDFEAPESLDSWITYGAAKFEISRTAAHGGTFGVKVTLAPAAAFSYDAIEACPARIPQTIFTFSIQAKSDRDAALVARIVSKDAQGEILGASQSVPNVGDSQWHPLVTSALTPPGTCVVGVDVVSTGPTEIESALDDAILVAHPGIVAPDGKVFFRGRDTILSTASGR
jgi:hypothetical protein